MKVVLAGNRLLGDEYGAAKLAGEFGADFVLEVARVDGTLEGPDMLR